MGERPRNALYYVLLLNQCTGTNPEQQDVLSHLLFAVSILEIFVSISLTTIGLLYDVSFENISIVAESVPIFYQMASKLIRLKLKTKQMNGMLKKMEKFWPPERLPQIEEKLKRRREIYKKIYLAYVTMLILTAVFYSLRPLAADQRLWPIPWEYHICDINANFCYVLVYIAQLYNGCLVVFSIGSVDGFFMVLAFNICEQLDMIKTSFISLETRNDGKDIEEFYEIIKHHNFALECITETDNIYNLLLFDQFWSSNFTICMGIFLLAVDGFPLDLSRVLKYASYLSTFILEVFIFCFFGQMISDECDEVASAVFQSKWYESDRGQWGKGVIMVTQMAHNSPKISIGKMLELNLNTFSLVLKNALSFCALIQSVYNF